MKAAAQTKADAEKQLQSFIGKFEPAHQALIRGARKALRKRLPAAHELVYDNYNFFVIGYSPTERPSDAMLSIAAAIRQSKTKFETTGARKLIIRSVSAKQRPRRKS